jgi:hypothetical protein
MKTGKSPMYDFDFTPLIENMSRKDLYDMQDMIDCLLDDPLANPLHVQLLIADSQYKDLRGAAAGALLGLYAMGMIEWSHGDPWTGQPGGWVTKKKGDPKTDIEIN